LAVQWLNEAFPMNRDKLCLVSSFVLADSLVLRNRQLLVAAKRYLKQNLRDLHVQPAIRGALKGTSEQRLQKSSPHNFMVNAQTTNTSSLNIMRAMIFQS